MRTLLRLSLAFITVSLAALLLLWPGSSPAEAEPAITATPSITRTPILSDWSYMPLVQGVVVGPTVTPTLPPPTMTASPTLTSQPPTATATATNTLEPTVAPSSTATPTATATATVTQTPQPTTTPQPTATATQTPKPTATSEPVSTGDIRITKIFFDGDVFQVESDEYVQIENVDNQPIKLKGWSLEDEGPNHTYTFPAYTMEPGETCRIYTDETHPEWCGLTWRHGQAIWNNGGDTATLKDSSGKIIDSCSYNGSGTSTTCRSYKPDP